MAQSKIKDYTMSTIRSKALPFILLGIMFLLMVASAWNESAIMDELAHIPAGYSYVALKDMRLNPEHPPLIKDIAGLPLLLLDLQFPTDVKAWAMDLNGQWDMGRIFLYEAGNDPDKILHWARFPMMLLAVLFGCILYIWTQRRFGDGTALLTLFLFAFSPTFIAHSRYVTTDLAASLGFLIGILTFIDFLEQPSQKNIIRAGVALGVAQLLKFSLVLLLPIYALGAFLWLVSTHMYKPAPSWKDRLTEITRSGFRLLWHMALISIMALGIIWIVYEWHVWNYPPARQLADATQTLGSFGTRWLVDADIWFIQHPATRAIGQYMLGVLMVIQRAAGGNTTYFLGEVTNGGWWYYFPLLYILKETAALHLLTVLAIGIALRSVLQKNDVSRGMLFRIVDWVRVHIAETVMLVFIAVYWVYSIRSTLNIGVRHVLPTFPFVYILVSKQIMAWIRNNPTPNPKNLWEAIKTTIGMYTSRFWRYFLLTILLCWMAGSVLFSFPYYLSYFNEFAGSQREAYRIVTDSNFDWGQDLKRLALFADKHNIDHIAVDYFGGGSPSYYLGSAFEPWSSDRGAPKGYFAISATFRQGAFGEWINGPAEAKNQYQWLRGKEPIARAGRSIFIYKFP